MNIQIGNLLEMTSVASSAAALYTNSSGQNALLQKVTFTNNGAAAVTLTVWWVPNGGSRGNGNMIVNSVSIAPKGPTNDGVYEAFVLEGHTLQAGDALHAVAGSANAINAAISGALVS